MRINLKNPSWLLAGLTLALLSGLSKFHLWILLLLVALIWIGAANAKFGAAP